MGREGRSGAPRGGGSLTGPFFEPVHVEARRGLCGAAANNRVFGTHRTYRSSLGLRGGEAGEGVSGPPGDGSATEAVSEEIVS